MHFRIVQYLYSVTYLAVHVQGLKAKFKRQYSMARELLTPPEDSAPDVPKNTHT